MAARDGSAGPGGQIAGVRLLDCTLRDGGYYNDWDFSRPLVQRYLDAVSRAGIPIVELGFRTASSERFLGPTAYTTDDYLRSLRLPTDLTMGVMVNAKDLVTGGKPVAVVDRLFRTSDDSPIDLVRIAANFGELGALADGVGRLHDLGYTVGVNLMQIAARSSDEIDEFAKLAAQWGIAVAYFADSFGGMQPKEVSDVVQCLQQSYGGPIGCHMHNNMSMALSNTMAAIDAGATYVDSTVLGMGRGPGNAQTEYLAVELTRKGLAELDVVPLLSVLTDDFGELQREHGWGANVFYFLSAAHNIHPTYIQEMTRDGRYSIDEIVAAIGQLAEEGGASFSRRRLESAAAEIGFEDSVGTWDATGWCGGRDVLIVGPGPQGASRKEDIEQYIRSAKPVVLALNAEPPIDQSLVDAYAICHPVRALIDADTIAALGAPVFMPQSVQERIGFVGAELARDYGIRVDPTAIVIASTGCASPRISSFPYALALAAAGGARQILLTGFDGFDRADPRQTDMDETFRMYTQSDGAVPVVSLTPTVHAIPTRSLYEPSDR